VDEYLRVKGYDDIYAIGDITDVAEEKMAYTAKLHADTVLSSLKGAPKKYSSAGMLYGLKSLILSRRLGVIGIIDVFNVTVLQK